MFLSAVPPIVPSIVAEFLLECVALIISPHLNAPIVKLIVYVLVVVSSSAVTKMVAEPGSAVA